MGGVKGETETGGGLDEEDEEVDDDEKEAREGLSGSGLLLPGTRAWRPRGGGADWLPWLHGDAEEEETTTGTTAAWGGAARAALEGTTATRGGGVSVT